MKLPRKYMPLLVCRGDAHGKRLMPLLVHREILLGSCLESLSLPSFTCRSPAKSADVPLCLQGDVHGKIPEVLTLSFFTGEGSRDAAWRVDASPCLQGDIQGKRQGDVHRRFSGKTKSVLVYRGKSMGSG